MSQKKRERQCAKCRCLGRVQKKSRAVCALREQSPAHVREALRSDQSKGKEQIQRIGAKQRKRTNQILIRQLDLGGDCLMTTYRGDEDS